MKKEPNTFYFYGKRILVMGLGLHGGGVGTVKFLLRSGAKVTVTDLRSRKILKPSLHKLRRFKNINYVLGRHRKEDFTKADLIVKNPAVPPSSPYLRYAKDSRIPVTSDLAIFLRLCTASIIGITGTRGKSTTTYLIAKLVATKHKRVFTGGNIRKSVLELLPKLKLEDWVVLELSSFQLADLNLEKKQDRKSPSIAIITNILRDHLNWHENFREYIEAKANIFRFQKPSDYLFINPDDKILRGVAKKAPAQIILARLPKEYKKIIENNVGRHYFSSVALAVALAKKLGVSDKYIKRVLSTFRGLEGREEEIAVISGTHFINDTTATSPDASMAAIRRFRKLTPKGNQLILIAGGQDKRLEFRQMIKEIKKKVDTLILLPGTATEKIKNQKSKIKKSKVKIVDVKSMREAVKKAYLSSNFGDYIILSPGAASFGLFLNEFDRGERFVKEVRRLGSRH